MMKGNVMVEERNNRHQPRPTDVSVPEQIWNKYRYLTIYASVLSTVLLVLQLWRQ